MVDRLGHASLGVAARRRGARTSLPEPAAAGSASAAARSASATAALTWRMGDLTCPSPDRGLGFAARTRVRGIGRASGRKWDRGNLRGANNMGVLAALTGNAAEITSAEGTELFKQVLMEDEHVGRAYQLLRDAFAFTDRRLILKDVQGLTGKKIEWHSIPYRSISHFSIETAGVNDWDAELKIYVSGDQTPAISKKFNRKLSIYEVGNVLAGHICPPA